jgi:hypothetical protein
VGQNSADAERHTESDVGGVARQVAQVQRGPQPDEEQRPQETLGDGEQLMGQPSWFADRGHGQAE